MIMMMMSSEGISMLQITCDFCLFSIYALHLIHVILWAWKNNTMVIKRLGLSGMSLAITVMTLGVLLSIDIELTGSRQHFERSVGLRLYWLNKGDSERFATYLDNRSQSEMPDHTELMS